MYLAWRRQWRCRCSRTTTDCFTGGTVVEAGGGVVAHGRRLASSDATVSSGGGKKGFCSSLLLLLFCYVPFLFVPFRYGFSNPDLFWCQRRFFLNFHDPLSFTSHYSSRFMAFPVFFPFLVCSLLSSLFLLFWLVFISLRFPLFWFLLLPYFISPACWRLVSIYRGNGARPLYYCAWGAGQRRVGWWARLARRGTPGFSSSRCVGFQIFYRAHDSQELMKK